MGEDINGYIGQRIRFFRTAAGLKQRELAEKLNLSNQQIQKYEGGKDQVSIRRLYDIAKTLDIPVIALLEENPDTGIEHHRHTLQLMKYFSRITDDNQRQLIVDIVRMLSEEGAPDLTVLSKNEPV